MPVYVRQRIVGPQDLAPRVTCRPSTSQLTNRRQSCSISAAIVRHLGRAGDAGQQCPQLPCRSSTIMSSSGAPSAGHVATCRSRWRREVELATDQTREEDHVGAELVTVIASVGPICSSQSVVSIVSW